MEKMSNYVFREKLSSELRGLWEQLEDTVHSIKKSVISSYQKEGEREIDFDLLGPWIYWNVHKSMERKAAAEKNYKACWDLLEIMKISTDELHEEDFADPKLGIAVGWHVNRWRKIYEAGCPEDAVKEYKDNLNFWPFHEREYRIIFESEGLTPWPVEEYVPRDARVAELVDAQDLGSCVLGREGSIPSPGS